MKYLIFGGTGSLGKKLIQRLSDKHSVAVYSRDEAKHWTIKQNLKTPCDFIVGDIRDFARVQAAIFKTKPDVIIIAAALKQVDTCELSPSESVATNLLGTQSVLAGVDAFSNSRHAKPMKVLFVSTDKACAPVNVYGMCKSISERLVVSESQKKFSTDSYVSYFCTRYGNVLESRGSIIPLFKHQVAHSDFITVTDPDMTRFLMTLDDSVDLIETTLKKGESGETWIPVLPAMRIGDLASIFARKFNKQVKIIGSRPGEKLHEDLTNASETLYDFKWDSKNYSIIVPSFVDKTGYQHRNYSSNDDVMSESQLELYLSGLGILDASLDSFVGRNIEEIKTS